MRAGVRAHGPGRWALGVLWAAVAVGLALYGRDKLDEVGTLVPEKTVETLKEDMEWLRHPTS